MGSHYLVRGPGVMFSYLLLVLLTTTCMGHNITGEGTRDGKVLSLFSIVHFPNLACTSTSATFSSGVCYTNTECSAKGGSVQGNCAAGFGVCCVFSLSASGSTISQNVTYITNPSYPSTYVPTQKPSTLTYTIAKCQDDICRIRLDYDTFILTAPSSGKNDKEGQCETDILTFSTTSHTVLPTVGTAPAGQYGNYPYLCGTNTGLHSYLDLSPTADDTATLTFTINDDVSNNFKIKVTQLSCSDPNVVQQQNCFQYFTGVTGTVSSYNYVGDQMLAATQFTHCIRQEKDHCCIQWSQESPTTFRAAGGRADDAPGIACIGADAAKICSDGSGCSTDFVLIPNSGGTGMVNSGVANSDRYCGNALSPMNSPIPQPVISCTLPFEIGHQTGSSSVGGSDSTAVNSPNSQFVLTYSQIPGTC